MKKLIQPDKRKNGDAANVRAHRLLGLTLLFSLLMVISTAATPAAFAQSAVAGQKAGQGSTPEPDTLSSAPGIRGTAGSKGYFARFPYAAAADHADTQSVDQETGVNKSDKGTQHTYEAYSTVIKMCDEGYGIAYQQIPMQGQATPPTARDSELFDNLMTTYGLPMSDSQFQVIQRENNQRLLELAFDPERLMWMSSATSQTTSSAASKSMANTGEIALTAVFDRIVNGDGNGALINVANEGAVAGLSYRANGDDFSIAEAVYRVQRMYKQVFIPMAILFLLPGAVISQLKSIASKGFGMQTPESQSPFDGILRSIVAIFLIPGTQVILSWSIDTGNSLAYSCRDWVDLQLISNWTQQLCYDPKKNKNAITPPNPNSNQQGQQGGAAGGAGGSGGGFAASGAALGGSLLGSLGSMIGGFLGGLLDTVLGGYAGVGDGLAANQPEGDAVLEQQDWMGQWLQTTLNGAMLMTAVALIILTALQVVTVCYLLLLGPLAGAFYAWPQVASTHLFRGVFGKWVDGAIKVSLWRFCWMAILAIMTQRIIYVGGFPTDLKWEVAVFICFLGLMVGVPAAPFTFAPYQAFSTALQIAKQSPTSQQAMNGGGAPGQTGGSNPGTGAPGGETNTGQQSSSAPAGDGSQQGSNNGTESPTSSTSAEGKPDKGDQSTSPPPGEGGKDGAAAGAGAGNATGVGNGAPAGGSLPPASGAAAGGAGGTVAGSSPAGQGSGKGEQPVNVTANVEAGNNTVGPTNGPQVPLTPQGSASKGNPTTISNPSTPPPAAGATATASADGGGEEGGAEGAAKKGAGTQVAAAAPDASGAIGQIASAANGAQPPPSSSKNEEA